MNTFCDCINEYIEYCEYRKRLDSKTLKAYKIDLKQFKNFASDYCDITIKNVIDKFITTLHKKYKPKTVKRKIASIKAYFHYLEYLDYIDENPFSKLDTHFREEKLLPKIIPFHSIQIFLSTLYEQKQYTTTEYQQHCCVRDIAVMELLFATGMRISELCSIKPENIDLQNNSVLIYGKGRKERILQIGNQEVLDALCLYKKTYEEEIKKCGFFFVNKLCHKLSDQSVRFMINKYAKLAGIEQHITQHMFRHSFATLLLEQDVDIRYIQQILGHSSISTTEIYTHVSNVKQKDILYKKHPRNLIQFNKG